MKRGAFDFLSKPVKDKDLLTAVRAAIERDTVARREQAKLSEIRARLDTLTPREREVLEQVVAGKLNKQIAGDLGIVEADGQNASRPRDGENERCNQSQSWRA